MNNTNKNILVAPLNWGLGHATRCIPVIRELEKNGFTPILASDGAALELLKNEFQHLTILELPSYKIEYAKNPKNLKWKFLAHCPSLIEAVHSEKRIVKKWVNEYDLHGIISDNRLGVYSKKIPSIYITHQINIVSGKSNLFLSKLHQFFIKKFDECWVPDYEKNPNLTGLLGHSNNRKLNLKYIGPISRLQKKDMPVKYDLMVILSGPEPQRSLLEQKLMNEIKSFDGEIIFIRGMVEPEQKTEKSNNITYYNFLTAGELETAFNESKIIVSRSGYTTIMDLAILGKKAFLIPTPGQPEQEYLAKKMKREGRFPYAKQEQFQINKLHEIQLYKGYSNITTKTDWTQLFQVFDLVKKEKHQLLNL
ncbi:MAG: glycosyltransferase [Flavobacterium sp.]